MVNEVKRIRVKLYSELQGHKSLEEAIQTGRFAQEEWTTKSINDHCCGRTIVSVDWSDKEAKFLLEGGEVIVVYSTGMAVQCKVSVNKNVIGRFQEFAQKIILVRGKDEREELWDRANVLEMVVNKSFTKIHPSGRNLFFYVEGAPILFFCLLQNLDDANRDVFLNWGVSQ